MLNSLLLMGSSINNKKISRVVLLGLLINIFFIQFGKVRMDYFISNVIIVLIITTFNKKIKNKTLNSIMSILSILIWSICVDIICYNMFPLFNSNLNLFSYIANGLIFNMKNVYINTFVLCFIRGIIFLFNKIRKIKIANKPSVCEAN